MVPLVRNRNGRTRPGDGQGGEPRSERSTRRRLAGTCRSGVVVLSLLVVACAGPADEVDALREALDRREAEAATLEERVTELEAEQDAIRDALATRALQREVTSVADELATVVEEAAGTRDELADLADQLGEVSDALAQLRTDHDTAQRELSAQLQDARDQLEAVAAELRGGLRQVEGETAGLADQLEALRDRVDVIQRRTQQAGAQ